MPGNPWVRDGLISECLYLPSTGPGTFLWISGKSLHLSTHLGDVLDGSCHGFYLCRVLNNEVLTKVTEQPPRMVGRSY